MRMVSFAFAGVEPEIMGIGPIPSTEKALRKAGLTIDDIGLFELNEAFAVQVLSLLDHFGIDDDDPRVNQWGGAIAIGHPLASSGVRLMIQLAAQFAERPDVRYGLTAMCVGLGQGGIGHLGEPALQRKEVDDRRLRPVREARRRSTPHEVVTHSLRARRADLGGQDARARHPRQRLGPHAAEHARSEHAARVRAGARRAEGSRRDTARSTALAVTGKPFILAAGADLSKVGEIPTRDWSSCWRNSATEALGKLHDLGVPSFVFINGLALGGGVEIGLNADYRTVDSLDAAPSRSPRCFLGLIPGLGRRLAAAQPHRHRERAQGHHREPAEEQPHAQVARRLFELGIADAMFGPANFLEDSIRWADGVISGRITVKRTNEPGKIERAAKWDVAIGIAEQDAREPHRPGRRSRPYAALELLKAAKSTDQRAGLRAPRTTRSPTSSPATSSGRSIYAFNLVQKRAKRPAGAPDKALARPVDKVGVIGAGLMARQFALLFVRRLQVPVVITDLDQARVDKGVAYIHARDRRAASQGPHLPRRGATGSSRSSRARPTRPTSPTATGSSRPSSRRLGVKQDVFAEVEQLHLAEDAILATNTSSLSVEQIGAKLEHPERLVGFHFFNPVAVMPLIEVVQDTADH